MATVDRRSPLAMLLLFGSYAASLMIVDPRGDFPLNDDWVYARDCIESARAGRLVMTGYESAWSLPQIALGSAAARAFGFSHAAFRAAGIAALLASGLLIDAYLRRTGLPAGGRLIALGAWIFNPVGYLLGLSFMTDLPFIAAWIAACFSWDMVLATNRRRWIAAALALTVLATAQRQFGLFIPVAAALMMLLRRVLGPRPGSSPPESPGSALTGAASAVAIGLSIAFFWATKRWMAGTGGYQAPLVVVERSSFQYALAAIRMVGFFALASAPLLLVLRGIPPGRWGGRFALGLTALAAAAAAAFLASGKPATFGNLISQFGLFPEDQVLLGRREVIFGTGWSWAFALLSLLAAAAMIRLACGVGWGQLRDFLRDAPAGFAPGDLGADRGRAGGFGGVLMIAGAMMLPIYLVRGIYFDRYLLPVLPAVWVALARCGMVDSRALRTASVAFVVASAAFSTTLAADYFRWNEARWAAARGLQGRGVPARAINAGYEWFGMMVGDSDHPLMNPDFFDYVVSFSGPTEGFREVDAVPWRAIWPPHDRKLHVLENRATRGR